MDNKKVRIGGFELNHNYLQIYYDDIYRLSTIKSGIEWGIVLWMGKNMNKYSNEVVFNRVIKQRMADEIEYDIRTINNTLVFLKKRKILISISRGIYMLNPLLFFRGKTEHRERLIERIGGLLR